MRPRIGFIVVIMMALCACQEPVVVKPSAMLRLDYPLPKYSAMEADCPFDFYKNNWAKIGMKEGCNVILDYSQMKAALYLTYIPFTDNLSELLFEAQKRTYDHSVRASDIVEQALIDPRRKVYGTYFAINGDAATQAQFYVTDSLQHFLAGALYFRTKPNFDSLYPAIDYIREDIKALMETITWTP